MTRTRIEAGGGGALFLIIIGSLAIGCGASTAQIEPVRLTELGPDAELRPPLVIELQEGDRIPLHLALEGDYLELEGPETPPTIVVKRRVFIHMDGRNPPTLSTDGVTPDTIGGSLRVGLGVSEERGGPFAEVAVTAEERE
jgi:hypothetical protein